MESSFLPSIIAFLIFTILPHFSTTVTIQIATFASVATFASESQPIVKSTDQINKTTKSASSAPNAQATNLLTFYEGLSRSDQEKLARLLEQLRGKSTQESAKMLKQQAKKASEPFKKAVEQILSANDRARDQLKREVRQRIDKMGTKEAKKEAEKILKIMTDKKMGARQKSKMVREVVMAVEPKVRQELNKARMTEPSRIVANGFKWNV